MKKNNNVDCVNMKNDIQEKIYEENKDLTFDEEKIRRQELIEKSELAYLWKKLKEGQNKKKKRKAA